MSKIPTEVSFPSHSLQPKRETGVDSFLNKYPTYDGRDVIIAILDSGVDPAAAGLQETIDGSSKIIDRIDATGAGDVDTSTIVTPDENGVIIGKTGRKLIIPNNIKNPEGTYRIGVKKAWSLYPKNIKDRIRAERMDKLWDPAHKQALARATNALSDFDSVHSEPLYGALKLEKENAEAELEMLSYLDKKFRDSDPGPIMDVVLYHDGRTWVCFIDNNETGILDDGIKLRPFRETGSYDSLSAEDKLNVSFDVYDGGDVVQIVGLCSSHGTHVACMAAGYFRNEPHKNGTAPGAKIVSITIGDGRLNSMETGTALSRALIHIMKNEHYKVDLINMSYGEHSHWSSSGRIGSLMAEVVNKHGVLFFNSAGNNGPALFTVGTPPDISTNTLIGIGAYVSPDMMTALYSSREKMPGTPYTWSSRGPTIDGDRGVTVCAPGGAITSVPQCTLKCSQLMNGTSMASPHACGAIASVVSGLKQQAIKYSAFNVKRALANTALNIPDKCQYAQGNGLLQTEKVFEYLVENCNESDMAVRYAITCGGSAKGIHLRGLNVEKPSEVTVKIEPVFMDHENVDPDKKINFNIKFALQSESPWVQCPPHLDLMYTARIFLIKIDPRGLTPGPHTTYVKGYNVDNLKQGCLFEVPVTVIIPEPLTPGLRPGLEFENVTFPPNGLKRHFVMVPDGATWGVIKIKGSKKNEENGKFVLHTLQLLPKLSIKAMECDKTVNLSNNGEFVQGIPVVGGVIIEICLAKFWANTGTVEVSYSISFYGIKSSVKDFVMHGGDGVYRFQVESSIQDEELSPEIRLKNYVQVVRPNHSKIIALKERDLIPSNRPIYQIVLTYNFNVAKATEITPNIPLFSSVLYESEYESQLWLLYDSNKQLIAAGDAYPSNWSTKVEKGDYTLKCHIRHEKKDLLDKLTDTNMLVSSKLTSSISLDVHTSFSNASTGGKKPNGSFLLNVGRTLPLYIPPVNTEKHSKNLNNVGHYFQGTLTLSKEELGRKSDVHSFKYIIPEGPKKDKKGSATDKTKSKDEKSKVEEYKESIRDSKICWLSKLEASLPEHDSLYEELQESEAPGSLSFLQVHFAHLQSLDSEKKEEKKNYSQILETSKLLLEAIPENDIMVHMATKTDLKSDSPDVRKELEKKKTIYLESLAKRGIALLYTGLLDNANETLYRLMKVIDLTDSRVIEFAIKHAEKNKQYGRALKLLVKQIEDKGLTTESDTRMAEVCKALNWIHCEDFISKSKPHRFPADFELF